MTRDRKEVFGGNVRQEAPYWREVFSLSIMQAVKIKEVDKFSVLPNVSAGLLRRGEKKKEIQIRGVAMHQFRRTQGYTLNPSSAEL